MMKRILYFIVPILGIMIVGLIYTFNNPEYLASKPELIPNFFSLPKEEIIHQGFVSDELHSQGKQFSDFGSAYYELKIRVPHPSLRRKMLERKETINTGKSLILTVKRGDILGTFELLHNSNKAYVHYNQIYDE